MLTALLSSAGPDRVSIGELIDGLGDRAFGVLILLCALPNCIPGPPGVSTVTGLPILLFALQLLVGGDRPWLPRSLRNRSFSRADLLGVVRRADPWLRRLERLSRPRLPALVAGWAERAAGFVVFLLAVILILPIPLGNLFPAIAIAVIAVALMEQDGAALLVGYTCAVLSMAISFAGLLVALLILAEVLERLLG
ncbi:exopolysaccharide biosynthesis protein [Rhodocista pekingensis]|uniref:Exopolysaccharide biosynthesis protein n=1 Tax=Rhodocista pekingensis TaxID=201185 RepID=A0ABW2KRJ0_9PROT